MLFVVIEREQIHRLQISPRTSHIVIMVIFILVSSVVIETLYNYIYDSTKYGLLNEINDNSDKIIFFQRSKLSSAQIFININQINHENSINPANSNFTTQSCFIPKHKQKTHKYCQNEIIVIRNNIKLARQLDCDNHLFTDRASIYTNMLNLVLKNQKNRHSSLYSIIQDIFDQNIYLRIHRDSNISILSLFDISKTQALHTHNSINMILNNSFSIMSINSQPLLSTKCLPESQMKNNVQSNEDDFILHQDSLVVKQSYQCKPFNQMVKFFYLIQTVAILFSIISFIVDFLLRVKSQYKNQKPKRLTRNNNNQMIIFLLISCFIIKGSFNVSAATVTMENQTYDGISNQQINILLPNEIYIINNCTFTNCFATGNGGALSIQAYNGASLNIIDCTFNNCTSEANGGAIMLNISAGSTSTFEGIIKFKNCTGNVGGASYIVISGTNSQLIISQMQFEDCHSSSFGGGLYLLSKIQSHVYIEQLTFSNCSSISNGGGTHIISEMQGFIEINNIKAEDCKCIKGNGGGIFVSIDFGNSSQFKMVNISLFRCKAQTDTTQDIPPTGYGGGIFLTGYGDYDPLSKMLDFRKMKIYGNTADRSGQSLYVAMTKVVEWCQTGTAGEYAKGNYSDEISNVNELQGIPVDKLTFQTRQPSQINSLQNYLEGYWNIITVIYFVQSTGNDDWRCTISNPCKTLDASLINSNINSINSYFVCIYDSTSISNTAVISQTVYPRIFRNYPLDSTRLSVILIRSEGEFHITGKVIFQLINFIMEGPTLQQDSNSTGLQIHYYGIYGLSQSSEIDLQSCEFHMQNGELQIGKYFMYLEIGGNHTISNLVAKDISSEGNHIKIDFNQSGSISITDSQFVNTTKIGNIVVGGAINAILQSSNKLDIQDCKFTTCKAQDTFGGAIYAEIKNSNAQITLTRTQFLQCYAQSGGGLSVIIDQGGSFVIENSCIFKECKATSGNGGGIYLNLEYGLNDQTSFVIRDALIQDCQAVASASNLQTGFGGGIFIGVNGSLSPPSMSLDLKGMKISGNSAAQGGQSLYAVMDKLKDWCEYGLLGEYVKGNYSDTDSNENDLQGIPIDFNEFQKITSEYIEQNQMNLELYWKIPIQLYSIWHVLDRNEGQQGFDEFNCGETNSPCYSIEYAIQQISLNKGGLETIFIEEKNIGISQYGYDLISPIQLGKSFSYTNIINIMKQQYGTLSEMQGQAEIKIMKNNDNNKENGKVGWISAFEGLQLHLYGLNVIMDNSQLLIPIIYIQDSDSVLELHTITFSEIKLSPSTESKGIIQIYVDNSQFIAQSCIFQNIDISSKGGNVIRILNSGSYLITSTIKGCQFNNISSIGDSNGRGGSAIYMQIKHGSKLIIDDSCQFYKCIIDNGNGGAIYIDIDFTSQFIFKINDTLIHECIAKENTSSSSPTGYGGGIFLTGSGDYDPSTNRLDLKGMKIIKNKADQSGQSLFVAMTNVKDWCQTGISGEFAKGNYSDRLSNFEDIEGISVNLTTFSTLSLESIQQQQSPLQYFWIQLLNLAKISATLNLSDTNFPLQIKLEGHYMIEGQFTVKIAELGQIDQINNLYEIQSQINILNKSSHQLLTNSYSNSYNINKLNFISNYAFEIIYPPEDGTSEPIHIEGDPQSQQAASFGMNDVSWMDYDNKHYGIFASNDRRIFSGVGGKENEAYPLEIIIEEDNVGKATQFPWWIILVIALSSLSLIIIILICCLCYCWRKYQDKKIIEINYNPESSINNFESQTEMAPQVRKLANNDELQNNQMKQPQNDNQNKIFNTESQNSLHPPIINAVNRQQSGSIYNQAPVNFNTPNQSSNNNNSNQYLNFSPSKNQINISYSQYNIYIQSQTGQSSSLHSVRRPSNNISQDFNPNLNSYNDVPGNFSSFANSDFNSSETSSITIPDALSFSSQSQKSTDSTSSLKSSFAKPNFNPSYNSPINIPKPNSKLIQSENNQTNQSLVYSTSDQLKALPSKIYILQQLQHSQNLSAYQFPEQNSQQNDSPLRQQQKIQLSNPEKGFDHQLTKIPSVYTENEQSPNNSNEHQTIINLNILKENEIPLFQNSINKK